MPQNIKNILAAEPDAYFYISGPPAMIRAQKKALKSLGVSRRRIKSDPFFGYK
jgi:ferredoxin-NADP reductase